MIKILKLRLWQKKKKGKRKLNDDIVLRELASQRVLSKINFLQSFVVVGISWADIIISDFDVAVDDDLLDFFRRNIFVSFFFFLFFNIFLNFRQIAAKTWWRYKLCINYYSILFLFFFASIIFFLLKHWSSIRKNKTTLFIYYYNFYKLFVIEIDLSICFCFLSEKKKRRSLSVYTIFTECCNKIIKSIVKLKQTTKYSFFQFCWMWFDDVSVFTFQICSTRNAKVINSRKKKQIFCKMKPNVHWLHVTKLTHLSYQMHN